MSIFLVPRILVATLAFLCAAAQLSAQDMPLSQILVPDQGWTLVAEGFKFTEGPATNADGELFFSDVPNSKIYKLNKAGEAEVFVGDSQHTNGLMFRSDGKLIGCRRGMQDIVAYDTDGKAETLASGIEGNDLVVLKNNRIYVTEPKEKRVWLIEPDGSKRVVAENIARPNGIIVWPDQQTLVVADSWGRHLLTFKIEKDGSLTAGEGWYRLRMPDGLPDAEANHSLADGMTMDAEGRLFVATRSGLQVFDTQGRISGVLLNPQRAFLSNVCFGGPDFKTLYVTCADKVYSRPLKVAGAR